MVAGLAGWLAGLANWLTGLAGRVNGYFQPGYPFYPADYPSRILPLFRFYILCIFYIYISYLVWLAAAVSGPLLDPFPVVYISLS